MDKIGPGLDSLVIFWKKLETAVQKAGGSSSHLDYLAASEADRAIEKFAYLLVHRIHNKPIRIKANHASFQEALKAWELANPYSQFKGSALTPDQIPGQATQPVEGEFEQLWVNMVPKDDESGCVPKIFEKYGTYLATLSEFIEYGVAKKKGYLESYCTLWKAEDGQVWLAEVSESNYGSDDGLITLSINPYKERLGFTGHLVLRDFPL